MKASSLITLLLLPLLAAGQSMTSAVFQLPDTARVFTLENFYHLVTGYHPVAKQADLLTDVARQEIRLARGNFDPKLEVQYLTKSYNDSEYYSIFNGSVTFPSVLPFDPKVGMEKNQGTYLNPERYISDEFNYQQLYAGISLPLGRGLITDERRTALRQAELFTSYTEAEQVTLINKLLLNATKEYWAWYFAYYNYRLLNQGVVVASEILNRTRINAELGEASLIDTVQAKITWQQRLIEQQEALLAFQNAGIRVSTFLWDSLSNPLALDLRWAPVLNSNNILLTEAEVQSLMEQARKNHPDLQKLSVKLLQLEADRKLAVEYLKPRLDLNYFLLDQPFDPDGNTQFTLSDNYKFGVDFSFPLFLRKERAKLGQVKLKINATTWERTLAEREVLNGIQASYNALTNNQAVLQQQQQMVGNYERLLQAEFLNLENGESDLFKINVQQEKLIQSQSKWVKLLSEYEKLKAELYWSAGVRGLSPATTN